MKVCPFACDISNDKVGCNHKFWFRIRHALDRMLQASKNLQWIKHQVTGTPTPFSKWHTILDTPINSTIINLNWYTISTFIHHRCAQRKTNDFHLPFGLVSAGARNPDAWYGVAGRRRANEAALANDSFELPNEVNASKKCSEYNWAEKYLSEPLPWPVKKKPSPSVCLIRDTLLRECDVRKAIKSCEI